MDGKASTMHVVDEAIQAAEIGMTEGRAAIQDLRPESASQPTLPEFRKSIRSAFPRDSSLQWKITLL